MFTKDFSTWLQNELDTRGWTKAELSRRSGISASQVTRIMNREQNPGQESLESIARALRLPPETVLRAAGLLPQKADQSPNFDELLYVFEQMTDDEQNELLAMGRLKIEMREKRRGREPKTQPRPAQI